MQLVGGGGQLRQAELTAISAQTWTKISLFLWCHWASAIAQEQRGDCWSQSLPGAGAQNQHSCLVQGYWHPVQVPGLKKLPWGLLPTRNWCWVWLLNPGAGKRASRLPKSLHGLFSGPLEMSLVLWACVEPASSACHSCEANKKISASNLLFSFSFRCIKRILIISAVFWEQPEEDLAGCESRRVHAAELCSPPHFMPHLKTGLDWSQIL